MPKKTALIPMETPDFSNILSSTELPLAAKRRKILEQLGLRRPKKRYASVEERKKAAKERAKRRKEERLKVLKGYGLEPRKKGPKLTKEQKRERRKARAKAKREFFREMAKQNPDLAKKFGIDPSRFKL
jgi:hypothetical protein